MVDRHVWLRTLMLIGAILVLPACAAGPGQTTATPSAQAIQPATEAKAPPPSPTPEATRVALSLTATPTGTWHTYRDPSYGFSLQYPPDWRQSIAFSQPYSKSILRRIEITYFNRERGDNAEIAIDIRPAYGDLLEWFQDELRTNAGALYLDPTHIEDGADSVTAYNAQLAGRPAIFVYEPEHNSGSPDMAQVYVADGEYFLVFTYWGDIPDNLENRATYLRALETVQFTGSATQGLALPETAFVAGVVTAPQIPNGSTVAGYVIAGYGAHRPIGDLPLWVGLESIGDPVTRTLSDGYFAIGDLPPGRVNIVDSHLAFQAFIPGMGARIDLGRLKYPLIHPPTYYYLAPDPLPNLSTLLDKGQSIDFAVCLTDPDWQRPSEPAQRDRVWSKPPFRDALADWLQWWFKQPAVLYDTTDRFVQSFPDGPNLDRLADDWRYLLGLWTGASVVDGSHCAYDDQTLEDLLARRQLEVWLLGYQAVRVRQLGNHFGVQVVAAPGYQVIRFPGVEAAIAVHLIENGREILQLPQNPPQQWTGAQ